METQSIIKDLKTHAWYAYLSQLKGYVIFYAQNEDELAYLSPIIVHLNRSAIVLCDFSLPNENFPDWIQVIEFGFFDQKVYENSFLENDSKELYDYTNTFATLFEMILPDGIVVTGNTCFQKEIIDKLGSEKQIPVVSLPYANKDDSLQQICKTINESFPFPYFNQVEEAGLHIGCGNLPIAGWLNTDLNFSEKVTFMNAGEKFPFPDVSFHYIFSEHLFEHLSYQQGKNMLQESYRVLKPDGVFRLTMPGLEFLMDIYFNQENELNEQYTDWSISVFDPEIKKDFQSEKIPRMFVLNNFMRFWGHQMIYDKETITNLLKKAGFTNITYPRSGESIHAVLENIEQHAKSIPEWANNLESFTIEARK